MMRWQSALRRAAGLFCLLFAAGGTQAAVVGNWSAPGGTSVQVGDTLRVQFGLGGLTSDAGSSLGLYDLDVTFSSSSLRFVGGSFMPGGAGNVLDFAEAGASPFLGDFMASGGTIDVFALSGNSQAVLDSQQGSDLLLFELVFEALAPDATAFVALDLADPFLLFGSSDPSVTLSPTVSPERLAITVLAPGGSGVPEPASAMLTLLALATAAATRRSRPRRQETPACA